MVKQLVALHDGASERPIFLPREGTVTIGRRPENTIVCPGLAVSGQHCKIICQRVSASAVGAATLSAIVEVIDLSTNGTFVNDVKLTKEATQRLCDGDVISLTKPDCEHAVSVRFRLEDHPGSTPPDESAEDIEIMPTNDYTLPATRDWQRGGSFAATKDVEGFAQDLLVQEQQSKAKITGELLLARRRLDEERSRADLIGRELKKAKAALEEERSRRNVAQDSKDKLFSEAAKLRADKRELQEMQANYDSLRHQNDCAEVELTAVVQKASGLEAAQERAKAEFDRAQALNSSMQSQLEELQTRLDKAQALGEELNNQRSDEKARVEQAKQKMESLQKDLASERAEKERLEDQQALLRADLERSEQSVDSVKQSLSAASIQHAELEERTRTYQAEAMTARSSASSASQHQKACADSSDALRNAASRFGESVRSQVDLLVRGLLEGGNSRNAEPIAHGGDNACGSRNCQAPTTPLQRPAPLHDGSAATESDDQGTAAATPEHLSAATQAAAAETPVASADATPSAADEQEEHEKVATPDSVEPASRSPAERQSMPLTTPEAPAATLPAQAPQWSLCILGGEEPAIPRRSLAFSPAGSTAPAETAILADTVSPQGPSPAKRRKLDG